MRRLISSGSSLEAEAGYSRAVVDGEWIFVAGTTGFDYAQMTIVDAPAEQARQAFRNIEAALAEARRVLKPGGRFLCLEFTPKITPLLQPLYELYSFRIVPLLGQIVAGDREAYTYLVESIRRFPRQSELSAEIERAGFDLVRFRNLTGGVAALHSAWRL